MKPKIKQAKSIKESLNDLYTFLESDLYTKFRPEHKIGKESWIREDSFINEMDFIEYLNAHFMVLENDLIRLIGKKEFEKERLFINKLKHINKLTKFKND
jgi:hypothetical protein